MGNLSWVNRADLSGHEGYHRHRLAIQRGKFDLIPFSASMNEHDRADIATSQAVFGKVAFQNHVF
jgi:hypothetical protein